MQPKEPYRAAVIWFERAEGPPNDREMLFFTFLLLQAKPAPVPELRSWAVDTLKYHPVYLSQGAAGLPADWRSSSSKVSHIFRYLSAGFDRSWSGETLDQIAKGFRCWHGKGRHDRLDAGRLKSYKAKGKAPIGRRRWLSFDALFFAAELIADDNKRTRLRAVLKIDEPMEQLPTDEERAAAAEAQRDAAMLDAATQKELKETAQAAARQAKPKARNAPYIKAATEARTQYTRKTKEHRAALTAANREALAAKAEALEAQAAERLAELEAERDLELQAEHGWLLQQQREGLNRARARARQAEASEVKAQTKVAKLERRIESMENESTDADEEEQDEEEEDTSSLLPFELLPRRDETTGRFQAESPEIHAVRLLPFARIFNCP